MADKYMNTDEIKKILISANELYILLKYLYYKCSESAITDYEYDVLEHNIEDIMNYYKIDIRDDVKYFALEMVDCSIDTWAEVDINVESCIEYARELHRNLFPLLGSIIGQMIDDITEDLAILTSKYPMYKE